MGYVEKFDIFLSSYLRQNKPGKCVSRHSLKKRFFRLWKHEVYEVEELGFFWKGLDHGFGQKFEKFSIFLF